MEASSVQIDFLMNIYKIYAFSALIIVFVFNLVYLKNVREFLNYIKEKYPEKWKQMGEPSIFYNNSPRNTLRVLKMLQEPDEIEDERLRLLKRKTKILFTWVLRINIVFIASAIIIPIVISLMSI